jgi:hypothetical protein
MTEYNGAAVPTINEMKARARDAYMNGFNDMMTQIVEQFLLPDDRIEVLADMAQFATFLAVAKTTTAKGLPPTRENLMASYWPFQKALKDEVPPQLRNLAEDLLREAVASVHS